MNTGKIVRMLSRAGLQLKKAAPTIMVTAGVGGMVGSTIIAVRQSPKAYPVYKTLQSELASAKSVREAFDEDRYSKSQYAKDIISLYSDATKGFLKVYWPAIALGVASIGLICGAHGIMIKRNAVLGAVLTATTKAFEEYRDSVRKELGEKRENELRWDVKEEELEAYAENGEDYETVNMETEDYHRVTGSPYARYFDEFSTEWQRNSEANRQFLHTQERWFNDRLRHKGHVFLNEVYDALGLSRTTAGQLVGWVYDDEQGDNFIDFGMFKDDDTHRNFINGYEKRVLLDFNVQGPIHELI